MIKGERHSMMVLIKLSTFWPNYKAQPVLIEMKNHWWGKPRINYQPQKLIQRCDVDWKQQWGGHLQHLFNRCSPYMLGRVTHANHV